MNKNYITKQKIIIILSLAGLIGGVASYVVAIYAGHTGYEPNKQLIGLYLNLGTTTAIISVASSIIGLFILRKWQKSITAVTLICSIGVIIFIYATRYIGGY